MTPAICRANEGKTAAHSPRIVNIINFVRQCEPRIDRITKDVLYDTVASQIKIFALDRGLGALARISHNPIEKSSLF